jgi:hypothetical protein
MMHMSGPLPGVSRRRLLKFAGVGGIAAAASVLIPGIWREPWPYAGGVDDDLSAQARRATLTTTIAFMGALFGRALTGEDQKDLRERLEYTVEKEPSRLQAYAVLARRLDQSARNSGALEFAAAPAGAQTQILDGMMSIRHETLRARLLSRISAPAARHYRMRSYTIPALCWLYANSGVAWRARGYERWPGIPGNWREILSAGKPYP